MKFFNLDCHTSVIADIKNIFENLGHQVDTWSLSGHRWVFNLPECKSPIINYNNWKNLDEKMVDNFYEFHKEELDKYDAFICTHHIFFLKLFERFRKPIIVVASTRYEYPCFSYEKLIWLEDSLKNNSNLILVANNQFDQKYCEKFLNNKWEWIPSLCEYTNVKYNKKYKNTILFSKFLINLNIEDLIHQHSLGKYTWNDLYKYKSILHFPYNTSTMSIFEQSRAGVPLIFPSLNFALELIKNNFPIFSEIVFPNSLIQRQKNLFLNEEWLKYSDFYNGTIQAEYFDSMQEMHSILNKNLNIKTINKNYIYEKWKLTLNRI
jgi:hypothetical protein